jgi:putative Ca2+/H+ antiporter (TMEM165/GDT1 family)
MLIAFALVFPVELPDKTLVATVLLAARLRPLPVFAGVSSAFAVHCVIAVAFGGVLTLLPPRVVAAVVGLLFGVGAFVLLREGFGREDASGRERGEVIEATAGSPGSSGSSASFWRIAATAFGVLFVAEFGDASQLATAALTARYEAPLSVGLGAFVALVTVAAIAVLVGKRVGDRLPKRILQRAAGMVFAVFALLALGEAVLG